MERRLRFMEAEMLKDEIYVPEAKEEPKTMHPSEIVSYEEWEDDVTEMLENQANLLKSYLELTELNYILTHIGPILGDVDPTGGLVVITGVVRRHKCFHFEMMMWRISRGNIYYRQAVEDKILLDPATKVISGFRANVYPCPETLTERTKMMDKIDERISDLKKVLDKTKYHRCKALRTVGKQWHSWMVQVRKAKAVFHHMNLFTLDITKNCLIGQCWVPVADLKRVQDTLKLYSDEIGTNVPSFLSKTVTNLVAPTFNRTNKFTYGFQKLINAYGLYTIITFPFLFGLMFGDIGHAILMTLFALWMINIYTGFIYNDMFSIAFSIKKTYFMNTKTAAELMATDYIDIDPQSKDHRDPYIFGFDPIHFKNYSSIYLEFIPELLLVCCLFLWLVFLIYFKWFTYSARDTDSKLGSSCAPQILILFIDMVLWKSSTAIPNCDAYMFSGQETIQRVLVSVFLACIPVLLLGKPIYLNNKNKKKRKTSLAKRKSSNFRRHEEDGPQKEEEPAEEITPFSELLIYQGVHTIEFALSTVSHTASYLRLWALPHKCDLCPKTFHKLSDLDKHKDVHEGNLI
ncbi:V-type proton ATPase subunit a [Operophtera brumata]|uniref:V-type proton ATPase subunit a n=1 Tax=Operophtera brumata TaxID=104452 RepID=A0A0L7LPD1_OPEBR|nr:V-type proton ATPase subunit a [Operophtera brumata]